MGDSEDKKSPVNIDVGVSAKAEVKTEIPSESSGRLLDALTNAIRPFTEKRGLQADLIRLQREEVLIEIAQKTKERAEIEGVEIQPVPNKTLVPLLEKASLEDADSPLINWWANLLLSAADPNFETTPYFSDLVAKITPNEAAFLERLWDQRQHLEDPAFGSPQTMIANLLRNAFEQAVQSALDSVRDAKSKKKFYEKYEPIIQTEVISFQNDWEGKGIIFRGIRLHLREGKTFSASNLTEREWVSLHICKGLQLLEDLYFEYDPSVIALADRTYSVTSTLFTDLGVKFMMATHRPEE